MAAFSFFYSKFRISYWSGKPAKKELPLSGVLSPKVTLDKWWKLDKKSRV
jgi:hypothetical protein